MLTREEFIKIIEPIMIRIGQPEDINSLEVDYQQLKYFSAQQLTDAVNYILTTYKYQKYPSLAEFWDALEAIYPQEATEDYDYKCGACKDTGIIHWPDTQETQFCFCEKGIRKKEFCLVYFYTKDIKKARQAAEEKDISGARVGPKIWRKTKLGPELTAEWHERVRARLEEKLRRLKGEKGF